MTGFDETIDNHPAQYRYVLGGQVTDYTLTLPDMYRGKTRQSASNVAAHSLGQVEAYFTVREVLAEASTVADGELWREHSAFGRWKFATLGYRLIK
ncbi:MAG: hypothetical protein OEV11_15600 [Deltaproteobacteria bacterium]|nr:hypothetical protein [Deltaproteobacteria bacterium]